MNSAAEPQTDQPRLPALHGVVVADFSRVLAGPLASMFLADLGATVIKVERPGNGDDTRTWGPPYIHSGGDPMSTYFSSVNRNKHSITLDLEAAADIAYAQALVARADVFIENFLPGKLAAFGLDAQSTCRVNPRLVYCSISGFGSDNPIPGYDFVVQAAGGLMSITGQPEGPATKVGVALVDVLTGLHACIGILAALRERESSGVGQQVQVNLLSSLLGSLVNQGAAYINGAGVASRLGNQHPSIAPYETLATSDAPLAVAVGNDGQFRTLVTLLGRPELATDPRFIDNPSRVGNRADLARELESTLCTRTAAHWTSLFTEGGIACGQVNDLAQAFTFAEQLGLHPIQQLQDVATLANPITLSDSPVRYELPPPSLGNSNTRVRAWLDGDTQL